MLRRWRGNAILNARIEHRRHLPIAHTLSYQHQYCWLALDQLPVFAAESYLCSLDRPNIMRVAPADYLSDHLLSDLTTLANRPLVTGDKRSASALMERVRSLILVQQGEQLSAEARVQLLTMPRQMGVGFNPVSFYFVYADTAAVVPSFFIAEITNTPWHERFSYSFAWQADERVQRYTFDKAFHVSPFFPMDLRYDWRVCLEGDAGWIHMRLYREKARYFDAIFHFNFVYLDEMPRSWFSPLTKMIVTSPFRTLSVIKSIYLNAWRLKRKRVPFYPHPRKTHESARAETPTQSADKKANASTQCEKDYAEK